MYSPYKFILNHQTLWLSAERCIYWEEENALILSDLHLGKSGHFRKSGIGVPQNIFKEDLQRLFAQIQFFKPTQLLIVGDLFHSHANKEMDMFLKWRNDVPDLQLRLIRGNHDILSKKFYADANIQVTKQKLSVNNFCFTHDINETCEEESSNTNFTFSGHVHPGISMNGIGKQSLRLPCFYFTKEYAILPAFSLFTGLYKITPKKNDKVFALGENGIVKIQ
ncbi:MAG TPA: ligase-associated DNA damage response endonuclease PdeM [Chitinophagaceae bacterium]